MNDSRGKNLDFRENTRVKRKYSQKSTSIFKLIVKLSKTTTSFSQDAKKCSFQESQWVSS